MTLLLTEPIVLVHEVNFWFSLRPELMPDEREQFLSMQSDCHTSAAMFDTVHAAVKAVTVWHFISTFGDLLHTLPRNSTRVLVLQILSTLCQLDYTRAPTKLKKAVFIGSDDTKWLKKVSLTKYESPARTSVKHGIETLAQSSPQLHYMLRLCQDSTIFTQAAEWTQQIEDSYRAHPLVKGKMTKRELDSLSDLAVIVTFTKSLSSIAQLIPASQKKQSQLCAPNIPL